MIVRWVFGIIAGILLAYVILSLLGCATTAPGEMEYARLNVPDQDESALRSRIIEHFGRYGWNLMTNAPAMIVFARIAGPEAQLNRELYGPPVIREARVLLLRSPDGITVCAGKCTVNRNTYEDRHEFMESPSEMRKILATFTP